MGKLYIIKAIQKREVFTLEDEFVRDIITLDLDDDTQLECEVLDFLEVDGQEYVLLYPIKEEEDGEVLVYRYDEDEEENPILSNIETDEEYEKVAEAFDALEEEWDDEFFEEDAEEE